MAEVSLLAVRKPQVQIIGGLQVESVKKFLVSEAVRDTVRHQSFSHQCHGLILFLTLERKCVVGYVQTPDIQSSG